jgi:dTMP kinase
MKQGHFITFEGIEGAGKSTQIKLLIARLQNHGIPVFETREPGATPFGNVMRSIVLNPENQFASPLTELFLFSADRAEHVEAVVRPNLAKGNWVVCDRYTDSTRAYQIGGRGLSADVVNATVDWINLLPQLTILLDCDPRSGLNRIQKVRSFDRFESQDLHFHHRIRDHYLKLAAAEPDRFVVVSADSGGPQELSELIWETVQARFVTEWQA